MSGKVHIIAEAGTNHGGSRATAARLIDIAREAKADSVKFQIIYPDGLYLPRFFNNGSYQENEVYKARAAAMLSEADYRALARACRERGIPMSASVFDARGLDLLCELDPPYIKIASCDLNNDGLLKAAAEKGRKLIVSTGMSSLGEVEHAVRTVLGTGNTDLVLMHCVSVYPCPLEKMNLRFLETLWAAFGLPVGLSDHTEGSLAAAVAVSMGVEWIEKHFTYDRKAAGFDHAYALEPAGLAQYVADVRAAERACERPSAKVPPEEAQVRKRARRSIYAARAIQPSERIREADLIVVRPEGPLTPNDIHLVVGKSARRAIQAYEPISLDMVG
ncbi:MAG: N-acetylneuraminate synthase family protein [Zavarzinella sp.]|nr:N-acetylneuraminate synthase family protein [Zavarzinella sp.]